MTTYVAITTVNAQQNGWYEVASGPNKQAVLADAENQIGDVATEYGTDIYRSTEHSNLTVVSKTKAKREFGVG